MRGGLSYHHILVDPIAHALVGFAALHGDAGHQSNEHAIKYKRGLPCRTGAAQTHSAPVYHRAMRGGRTSGTVFGAPFVALEFYEGSGVR